MKHLGTWYQEPNLGMEYDPGVLLAEKIEERKNEITDLMKNLIYESVKYRLVSMVTRCFFLKKNMVVYTHKDLRTIGLAPSICILYENMIADECSHALRKLIEKQHGKQYQFGGARHNSTIDAIYYMFHEKRSATDLDIFIDISSAYESVRLDLLMTELIEETDLEDKVKIALISIVYWYFVTDLDMDGTIVKRTQSLGMGNIMTPVLFCYYLHKALMKIDRTLYRRISAFIDDILVRTDFHNLEKLLDIMEIALGKYNLKINLKKTEVMATPIVIALKHDYLKKKGVNIKKKIRYLGAYLSMIGSKVTFDQKKIGLYLLENKVSLHGISLYLKIVYLNSSITGKWRYGLYTLIVERNRDKVFNKIRRRIAKFTGYYLVDFSDVIAFGLSPVSIMTRMVTNTAINENESWDIFIDRIYEKIADIINNSQRLSNTLCIGKDAMRKIVESSTNYEYKGESIPLPHLAHQATQNIVNTVHRMILGEKEWVVRTKLYRNDIFYSFFNNYVESKLPEHKLLDIENLRYGAMRMIVEALGYLDIEDPEKDDYRGDLLELVHLYRERRAEKLPAELLKEVLLDAHLRFKKVKLIWKVSDKKGEKNSKERKCVNFVKKNLLKFDMLYLRILRESEFRLTWGAMNDIRTLDVKKSLTGFGG